MSRASRLSGFTTAISGDTDLNVGIVTAQQLITDQTFTFTNLNVTGIATVPVISGVTTIGSDVVVGGATTALVVNGDARVTGILTVGTSSLTLNGTDGTVSGINTINGLTYPSAGSLSNRNLIINGAMNIAQRATSVTGINDTTIRYATVDRGYHAFNSLGTWTSTQESDAPVGFSKSWKVECTTADASPATDDYAILVYRVEAQDLQILEYGNANAKTTTFSFYVKSNKTGTASFELSQSDNTAKQFITTYTINSADTWEYKTVVIPGDASGVIDNNSGVGMQMAWWLNSGSKYTGEDSTDVWEAANNDARNNSNLGLGGAVNDYFQITGIQWEVGTRATPFEHKTHADNLFDCQRYFQRIQAGRVNSPTIGYAESSQVVVQIPLHRTPRVPLAHDVSGRGTLTKVGDIAVNAFSSSTNNVTGIHFFASIGNALTLGLLTSGSFTNGDAEIIRYGNSGDQVVLTLDTEI